MAGEHLEKQARRRWRNGRWELWHPNVLSDRNVEASGHKVALAGMAELSEDEHPKRLEPWVEYPETRNWFKKIGEKPVEVGERIWVDEYGTDFEVGNPQDAWTAFTSGGCHIFAAVAHEETGWPIVAFGYKECVNGCSDDTYYDAVEGDDGEWSGTWCECTMSHFYVRDPDGRLWDVASATDEEAVLDTMDEFQIREVPDEVFSVVMTAWGSSPELVGWARQQIVESDFGSDGYSLFS